MATNACDTCGWLAAVGGALAFGSFGVPIKSKVARDLDIDPLVMQTYKTTMCFLTSWLVLLYGEKFTYTSWGIVSGLFWVPSGISTIFAIKNAGLAIAIGVGSSFIVLVSFTWGIFVFGEHVHSRLDATLAVLCMMMGLLGMAWYSAPTESNDGDSAYEAVDRDSVATADDTDADYHCVQSVPSEEESVGEIEGASPEDLPADELPDEEAGNTDVAIADMSLDDTTSETHIVCCGVKWSRRTLGILSAMFTGIYGGSIMAPMKWAPPDAKGLGYLVSFGIGAATVTVFLWILRYLYLCQKHQSFSTAYTSLPSFHIRKMWLHGGTCGLLWSIGNFFSLISVEYLGEGVGYSVVQSSILISGLWGIFYFKEVHGGETIAKWLLAAVVTVAGILLLSYEHHAK